MRPRLFWEQKTWKQSEFTSRCQRKVIMYRYGCSSCTWAVKFHTDHQMNQSKRKANSCSRRQAREIACGDVAKGSSLFLIGRKCGATIFQPTIKRIRTKFTLDWIIVLTNLFWNYLSLFSGQTCLFSREELFPLILCRVFGTKIEPFGREVATNGYEWMKGQFWKKLRYTASVG